MNSLENIKKKLDKIPDEYLNEVENLVDNIMKREKKNNSEKKMRLNLRGALKEFKDEYTSVELQHKAMEWMVKDSNTTKNK